MSVSAVNNTNNSTNSGKLKKRVAATTVLATGAMLAHIAKKQGFSFSSIKSTPVKDWAVFRLYDKKNPLKKTIELEEKEIIKLASASTAGGLIGGLLFDDKQYRKSKIREAVNQLLGNVLVPISCVGAVSRLYKKNKETILSLVPQIKESGKFSGMFNKALKAIPFSLATITALGIGIFTGNKVSNLINEKVFKKETDRKIKGSDFAPHVDDIGVALTLMADKSKTTSLIQRTVPAFLCVPGYEVGIHRD